ncbi:PITH domain-containing protein CG6153 [Teleopsis dalmanni]|uniref:PITH domain-containing protein CG6153 n=1 Tax=Teleopsis dalmanni TaxID=139649 RepID=UPI0018CFCAC9|nr:PITH domain-containing protein CG6153 [Teleopsis dalmanni]
MPHDHQHGSPCGHEATHDDEDPYNRGIQYSLYTKIDMDNVVCLNEEIDGSGRHVFKPFENRNDVSTFVQSDGDEELLFNIPFTGNVKLKGIIIGGPCDDTHPKKMRLFKNRPNMTFDEVGSKADQEFELVHDPKCEVEYGPKIVLFSSVHHLSIHIPTNYGSDVTRLHYIGLRGEFTEAHQHGVTICTYESRPNVSDHKEDLLDHVNHTIQ